MVFCGLEMLYCHSVAKLYALLYKCLVFKNCYDVIYIILSIFNFTNVVVFMSLLVS